MKKLNLTKFHFAFTVGRFLYDFFETIIEKDLRYIEEMSDRLIKKETAVRDMGKLSNPKRIYINSILKFFIIDQHISYIF